MNEKLRLAIATPLLLAIVALSSMVIHLGLENIASTTGIDMFMVIASMALCLVSCYLGSLYWGELYFQWKEGNDE